jgi:hypothetical protein
MECRLGWCWHPRIGYTIQSKVIGQGPRKLAHYLLRCAGTMALAARSAKPTITHKEPICQMWRT